MKLTDKEVAVIIDSLGVLRGMIQGREENRSVPMERREAVPTPVIDSALEKINALMTPATDGLYVGVTKWSGLSDEEIVDVQVALDTDHENYKSGDEHRGRVWALAKDADAELTARGLQPDD